MAFDAEALARGLKVRRAERGWSQQDLADKAGISVGSVARYESCKNAPTFEQAVEMADAFGCSLDDLFAKQEPGG